MTRRGLRLVCLHSDMRGEKEGSLNLIERAIQVRNYLFVCLFICLFIYLCIYLFTYILLTNRLFSPSPPLGRTEARARIPRQGHLTPLFGKGRGSSQRLPTSQWIKKRHLCVQGPSGCLFVPESV